MDTVSDMEVWMSSRMLRVVRCIRTYKVGQGHSPTRDTSTIQPEVSIGIFKFL
jgi:hypothetical protein